MGSGGCECLRFPYRIRNFIFFCTFPIFLCAENDKQKHRQKNYRNCAIEQMHRAHNMNANHPFTSLPELFISFYSGVMNCMRYSKRFFLSAFADSSMFLACILPLSPSSAPPTMRAISQILPSSESCLTVEPVRSPSTVFSTRYC